MIWLPLSKRGDYRWGFKKTQKIMTVKLTRSRRSTKRVIRYG